MNFSQDDWPRVSALLDTALELPKEQRTEWLENLIESQQIKSQLGALLFDTATADELLCRPPDISAALLGETRRFQLGGIELQPDRLIGPYRLLRELGKGGMGTVWLAQRVDGKIKREVALKFPYTGPRQREMTERLLRERDILASLEHPNIARLYDADVTASGQPFLVLEYINGVAINDYCDQHRLDIRQRLTLFQQVLKAVRYAHAHLVIHRDLKPSNILVSNDGIVHLLDFGIATSIAEGTAHRTPLTQFSGRVLTPEYASPEQVNGTALTTTSDVYVLGVVLYELLAGTLPYRWQRNRRMELEQAVADAEVEALGRAAINDEIAGCRRTTAKHLRKMLGGDLECIVSTALKKQPDHRYASADALADDVMRYLDNKPIFAQPDSEWYRIKKFMRRNRGAVASIAAIMIALLAGIATTSWQAHVAKQQRDRAITTASRSEAIAELMRLMVTDIADVNEPITTQTLLSRAEEIAKKTFSDNIDQRIAILDVLGQYHFDLEQYQLAEQSYTKALGLARNTSDQPLLASLMCRIGLSQEATGNTEAAASMVDQGMSLSGPYPEIESECLDARAYLRYLTKNDIRGMIDDLQLAQSKLQSSTASQPLLAIDLSVSLADAEVLAGHPAAAIKQYSSAIMQLQKLGRGEQLLAMSTQAKWANAELNLGNPNLALFHLEHAQEIAKKRGAQHNETEIYSNSRAIQLFALGRYQEALQAYQHGIDYALSNHNIPGVVEAKQGLARVLLSINRVEEAQQIMKDIQKLATSTKLTTSGIYSLHMTLLEGMLDEKMQRYPQAIENFSKGVEFLESHNEISNALGYNLGLRSEAYLQLANLDAARVDAVREYDIARKVQEDAPYSKNTGEAALLLAKIDQRRNSLKEAKKWVAIAYQQLQGSVGADNNYTLEAKRLLDSM